MELSNASFLLLPCQLALSYSGETASLESEFEPEPDPNSFTSHLPQHLYLHCRVDFGSWALQGTAALTLRAERDGLRCLVLDTKDRQIYKVTLNGQEAKFALEQRHSFKGTPLEITLPFELRRGQDGIVEISFETSQKSSVLQWLTPEQTSGKKHPFLFSQCKVIHCRAILPCQDTPSVKFTYYAEVSVPIELVALMSANHDGEMPDPEDCYKKIYRFSQKVPISSDLIALVVGALESRSI
ncbi:leukotriene A-4 hydrolase-like [Emys orbicularis]|uniref:leukotriene A-4 hydrolase-like n=1 Tax=Emys orbicularis TaxID=82168 RepID=UPI0031FE15AF